MNSICYSVNITRSDVIKATSKLAEYFINSSSEHLNAANHCIQYLYETKHLAIRYFLSKDDELIVQFSRKTKHVFENTIDVSFANSLERRSHEDFIFKLYEEIIN